MEGIASEAASFAGHQQLGKLIYVYDNNHISIDGHTSIAFTEERGKRFEAYGWHVQHVKDGNDVEAIDRAISAAKSDARPSLVVADTIIGYGLPTKQGTEKAHGEPPGDEELNAAKDALGWPQEPRFLIPEAVAALFGEAVQRGASWEAAWTERLAEYKAAYPEEGEAFARILKRKLPDDWDADIPTFAADEKGMATRAASGTALNAIAGRLPDLLGGSADLEPSNKTWIKGDDSFQPGARGQRNFHFGVREHAMGGIVNGMSLYPGVIPYGGTFLVFSDYMRGAIRLSALSHYPSIWVFTHDSIGVGEDGPTHQPVEHLAALRLIPDLVTIRPGDANETAAAWRVAIERRNGPTALALSRQSMPTLDRSTYADANELSKGAYVLADMGDDAPELILMASGSEVQWIVKAGERLAAEGTNVRLVSFPSWELFEAQDQRYRDSVLIPGVRARLAVEAGSSFGWARYVGDRGATVAVDRYGASAPGDTVMSEYGFTAENVMRAAMALLDSLR
jgi:transketolase